MLFVAQSTYPMGITTVANSGPSVASQVNGASCLGLGGLPTANGSLLNSGLPLIMCSPLLSIWSELGEDFPLSIKSKIINGELVEFETI